MPNLKTLLKRHGSNQSQLATAMGVSRQLVWYWCKARVPAERAHDVAGFLCVPMHAVRPDLWRDIDDRR